MSWNPVSEAKKWFNRIKNEGNSAINKIKREADAGAKKIKREAEGIVSKTKHDIEGIAHDAENSIKHVADDAEKKLEAIGEDIAESMQYAVAELAELATSGLLEEALNKALDFLEKEIDHGKAEIKITTTYVNIVLTDAKLAARVIRDAIKSGLPTDKSGWRKIIVDLAPKAVEIKPGIPLIAGLVSKIPLEALEKKALDELLKKAGL